MLDKKIAAELAVKARPVIVKPQPEVNRSFKRKFYRAARRRIVAWKRVVHEGRAGEPLPRAPKSGTPVGPKKEG